MAISIRNTRFLALVTILILGYPRSVEVAPEMNLVVRNLNGTPAASVEVVRTLKSYKIFGDYKTEDPVRTNEIGAVVLPGFYTRLPLAIQGFLWLTAFGPHGSPYTGGRVHTRSNDDRSLWDDVGFDENDCCPRVLILQSKDFELSDGLFYN